MPSDRSLDSYSFNRLFLTETSTQGDDVEITGIPGNPGIPVFSGREGLALKRILSTGNGVYLGASIPKRVRRGTYGRKVASWAGALQNQAGTTSFVTNDLPPYPNGSTRVLRLDQNAAISFGQQSPAEGGQAYMPKNTSSQGFSAGVWAKNLSNVTLNFELRMYNVSTAKSLYWNCAIDPGLGWVFLTLSQFQRVDSGGWIFGTDTVNFIRVSQKNNGPEGAWPVGAAVLFGDVYVEPAARPKFCLTFDDGLVTVSSSTAAASLYKNGNGIPVTTTAANVLTFSAAHGLVVGEPLVFTDVPPTSLSIGVTYYVQTVPSNITCTLATDAALTNVAVTTGFAGTARYQYGGSQAKSIQDLLESYGFRGTLFIVPPWLNTQGKFGTGSTTNFMTTAQVLEMWRDGWAVGSHSNTHPANAENAGLRLLGPYGFFLSNTFDNLPAQYVANFGITSGNGRRRVNAGTQASPSVFTTENAHQFLLNQEIVFTDVAPTGCQLGVTYYIRTIPTTTTFTLARDQGSLAIAVNNTTAPWAGLANYRQPRSTNNDQGIYDDLVAGAEGLKAIGIPTGYLFMALPQGGMDEYVRSACMRAGFKWIRGIGSFNNAHTIPIGQPSGGGYGANPHSPGGWIAQPEAVQADGAATLAQLDTYINDTISQGACGCIYFHALTPATLVSLDRICQTLKTKESQGLIDVLTLDELVKELGLYY